MKELELKDYRAAMVEKRYQAQVKCTGCREWVLTTNLEVFKALDGTRVAEATHVTCTQSGCGSVQESLLFKDWPYSAPVTWRRQELWPA